MNASSRLDEAIVAAKEKAREAGEMEVCDVANYLYCGVKVFFVFPAMEAPREDFVGSRSFGDLYAFSRRAC